MSDETSILALSAAPVESVKTYVVVDDDGDTKRTQNPTGTNTDAAGSGATTSLSSQRSVAIPVTVAGTQDERAIELDGEGHYIVSAVAIIRLDVDFRRIGIMFDVLVGDFLGTGQLALIAGEAEPISGGLSDDLSMTVTGWEALDADSKIYITVKNESVSDDMRGTLDISWTKFALPEAP